MNKPDPSRLLGQCADRRRAEASPPGGDSASADRPSPTAEAFRCWLVLLEAIEERRPVPEAVRSWFVRGARQWSEATGEKPLHGFLNLTHRRRQDYLRARQAQLLRVAADATAKGEPPWRQAAAVAAALRRYEAVSWRRDRGQPVDPNWSARHQAFATLLALQVAAPRSPRRIFGLLTQNPERASVGACSNFYMDTKPHSGVVASAGITEAQARREFDSSAELQHEFFGDFASYFAFRRAEASGQIRYQGRRRHA